MIVPFAYVKKGKRLRFVWPGILLAFYLVGCTNAVTNETDNMTESVQNDVPSASGTVTESENDEQPNPGLIVPEGTTLEKRILPPEGFERTVEEEGGLGQFLRAYPMKEYGSPVLLYNGKEKGRQSVHAAVFALPLEAVDLQQCADSVMRVYAEYFYHTGQHERIRFHFTNGFLCDFDTWKTGKRVSVSGNHVTWADGGAAGDSYEIFCDYLHTVFTYAGTLSMTTECEPIEEEVLAIGDVFLKGGSPGHVCMVIDTCENEEGRKAFLLAQGYMPAQEFHVLNHPLRDDPWYYEDEITYPFDTPEYVFEEGSLMRPMY